METTTKTKKATTNERIYLPAGEMAKLRKIFRTSQVTLWKALTFKSETPLAKKIRYVAVKECGGTTGRWTPDCETLHEDGKMIQKWGDRVQLVLYKAANEAVMYVDGAEVVRVSDPDIPGYVSLQQEAELTSLTL